MARLNEHCKHQQKIVIHILPAGKIIYNQVWIIGNGRKREVLGMVLLLFIASALFVQAAHA